MWHWARAPQGRYATRFRIVAGRALVFRLALACVAVLPSQVQAQVAPARQEAPGRFMLEAGIAGDSRGCPGHYVGIDARLSGPVSLDGMVENYRCGERTEVTRLDDGGTVAAIYPRWVGTENRIGASVRLGRST